MGLAAGAMGSAIIGAGATLGASAIQSGGANASADTQMAMYNRTRQDLLPYMQGGQNAFTALGNLMGLGGPAASANMLAGLQNYPGYQWALSQGQNALDQSAASRGLLLSGGQIKDTTAYGQGMANQLYNQYFGQLMGMSQLGQASAAMTGQQGTYAAQGAGMAQMAGSNAWANGMMGAANNLFGQNGALNDYLLSQMMSTPGGMQSYGVPMLNGSSIGLSGFDNSMPVANFSDRRAKENVRRIGVLPSGLPLYAYRYKGGALPQVGVMADEVERVAPEAVRTDGATGLKKVVYSRVAQMPARRGMLPQFRRAA